MRVIVYTKDSSLKQGIGDQAHRSLMFWLARGPVVGISCRYGHSAPRLHSPFTKKLHSCAWFLCTVIDRRCQRQSMGNETTSLTEEFGN